MKLYKSRFNITIISVSICKVGLSKALMQLWPDAVPDVSNIVLSRIQRTQAHTHMVIS